VYTLEYETDWFFVSDYYRYSQSSILKLVGLVLNKSQPMGNKVIKDDAKIVLILVNKNYEIKFENSVVMLNVTEGFVWSV
jgi:hypothetical protein